MVALLHCYIVTLVRNETRYLVSESGQSLLGEVWLESGGGGLVVGGSCGGVVEIVVGAEAEDVVHFEDDGASFAFVELALGVLEFVKSRASASANVLVFLEGEGFAGEAGEGINDASVFVRVVGDVLGDGSGGEMAKEIIDLSGGRLKAGLWKPGSVSVLEEFGGGFVA